MDQSGIIPSKAGKKQWIGLAVLALPTLLVSMDATVTYLAIPVISAELKPSASELLWITDIFTFMEGGLLITMGTLGDRIGRKKLLIYGALAFTMASVLAAFAQTPLMLIAGRALLGVAGATLLPSTVALIRSMFTNDRERATAIGIWTTCFSTGTMLGPLLGGLLLSYFWWGSVFLIAVPVMVIFIILGPIYLPEHRSPYKEPFDLVSALLLLGGILSVIYAIKRIGEYGELDLLPLGFAAAGVFILFLFLYRQQKSAAPLIDLKLFRIASFNATLLALLLVLFSWAGVYLFVAQYLQLALGFDPLKAGIWTIPSAAISMCGCMIAPVLSRWFGRNLVIVCAMIVLTSGLGLLFFMNADSGLGLLIPSTLLMSTGTSIAVTLGVDKVISSVPAERAGAAAGLYETSTTFGSALGVAILGSIGSAVYRSNIQVQNPGIKNNDTFGEAVDYARQLAPNDSAVLFDLSRNAFVHSFSITAAIAAVLLLLAVVFVGRTYRLKLFRFFS